MITGATLFSGGGGVECGMVMAGVKPLWGIEKDDKIAQVARDNGFHVVTGDVTTEDPSKYERVNILHASPPCINASIANKNRGETEIDVAFSESVIKFVEFISPDVFTLENVRGYISFESFKRILFSLNRLGYTSSYNIYNAADFLVPQNRYRLIMIASKKRFIPLINMKHNCVDWWDVVKDHLRERCELTPWQQVRLGSFLKEKTYILESQKGAFHGVNAKENGGPCFTISSSIRKRNPVIYTPEGLFRATPEILKIIQSFPEEYVLPKNRQLACHIIGNAVPPLMYSKILEHIKLYAEF